MSVRTSELYVVAHYPNEDVPAAFPEDTSYEDVLLVAKGMAEQARARVTVHRHRVADALAEATPDGTVTEAGA